jgi:hypothetical protein
MSGMRRLGPGHDPHPGRPLAVRVHDLQGGPAMTRLESHFQIVYVLGAVHWIIARHSRHGGWEIVEMRETRTDELDVAPTKAEADVLAQTYAVLVQARLTGAA